MKKLLSLMLALAMVLSLSAVAFAAANDLKNSDKQAPSAIHVDGDHPLVLDAGKASMSTATDLPSFGKTVYYALYADADCTQPITRLSELEDLKVSAKWDEGAQNVQRVELVRKSVSLNGGEKAPACFVAVTTGGSSMEEIPLDGKIYLKGTVGSGKEKEKINHSFNVRLTIGYGRTVIDETQRGVEVAEGDRIYDLERNRQDEFTFTFGDIAEAVTDVASTDELLLGYDTDEIEILSLVYNVADLDFVSMRGAFRKTATVTIYAEPDTYLYQYADGRVTPVSATYDEIEEGFVFKTKTLGTYVISDIKLPSVQIGGQTQQTPAAPKNPSTGAAL